MSPKLVAFYMNNRHPFLRAICFVFRLKKIGTIKGVMGVWKSIFFYFSLIELEVSLDLK